jgi:hypothetical protein
MIRFSVGYLLTLISFLAILCKAQQNPPGIPMSSQGRYRIVGPPSAADLQTMADHVKAYAAAQIKQDLTQFTCTPLASKNILVRNIVEVDLRTNPRQEPSAIDPERFRADDRYSNFVEARQAHEHVDLGPMMRDVFSPDAQLTFTQWSTFSRPRTFRVALFTYTEAGNGNNREARVDANPSTGEILRIRFLGFDSPENVPSLYCWPGQR